MLPSIFWLLLAVLVVLPHAAQDRLRHRIISSRHQSLRRLAGGRAHAAAHAAILDGSDDVNVLMNRGQDCWEPCNQLGGFCDWCGDGNACCRRDNPADPDECYGIHRSNYIAENVHECVSAPSRDLVQTKLEPSIFLAVFSRRSGTARREVVRGLWSRVANEGRDAVAKFAICSQSTNSSGDELDSKLLAEQEKHGDLLLLECKEGYAMGALTRKVLSAMHVYRNDYHKEFFMKIDDDTFLAWRRFARFLKWHASPELYMGVPINQSIPCRNMTSRWYEPRATFSDELFPVGFAGGSGYVLGSSLVDSVLDSGTAESNILWNEDRAVSVWIDKLSRDGHPVDYVSIPGISGFWGWQWHNPTEQWGLWRQYPHIVQHGLKGQTIRCLSEVEEAGELARNISACYQNENGQDYEPLTCAYENEEGMRLVEEKLAMGNWSSLPSGHDFHRISM